MNWKNKKEFYAHASMLMIQSQKLNLTIFMDVDIVYLMVLIELLMLCLLEKKYFFIVAFLKN